MKSNFQKMKERDKGEVLSHLLNTSHLQQLEDRRTELGQSHHYKQLKRNRVMNSLIGSRDGNNLGWDIFKCRRYNIKRYYHNSRKVLGPWWNRVVKETMVLTGKEVEKHKLLIKQLHDEEIDQKTYERKCRKLKWVSEDTLDDHRKAVTSFRYSSNEVNVKALDQYLKKTKSKAPCQSLWCPNCRYVASEVYYKKVQSHIQRRTYREVDGAYRNEMLLQQERSKHCKDDPLIRANSEYNPLLHKFDYHNKHINHVTGVVGLFPIDSEIVIDLLRGEEKNKWKRISRRLKDWRIIPSINDPWFEAVYEFELVNWKFLKAYSGDKDKKKKQQIEALRKRDKVGNKFLFVHFHALTNMNREEIRKVFEKEYWIDENTRIPKSDNVCGMYIQGLNSNKTLSENLDKICSYPFKDPYRYKHTFIGDDYSNGEPFTQNELKELILFYQKVQGNNWKSLFRSLSITNIEERDQYAGFYHSKHEVWNLLKKVWIVDNGGNVFILGWNPDDHPSFRSVKTIERFIERSPSGRKYGWYKHFKPHKLLIYSNIYNADSYYERWRPVEMTLWDYYHSAKQGKNALFDEHIRGVDLNNKTHGRGFREYNPQMVYYDAYKVQALGVRTVIPHYTYVDVKGPFDFIEMYEEVKDYKDFINKLGIGRESLSFKKWKSIIEGVGEDGYVNHISRLQHFKEVEVAKDIGFFSLDESEVVKEEYTETRLQSMSYEEWLKRGKKDTYPKNYHHNVLEDYGLDDEEVIVIMDDELDDEVLLLPPPNQ